MILGEPHLMRKGCDLALQDTAATVLYEVEGKFKVAITAIIRVGDADLALIAHEKVGHTDHLLALGLVMRLAAHFFIVLIVHNHDIIEVIKVFTGIKLARNVINLVPPHGAMPAHSLVGQLADMPTTDAGGIDREFVGKSCIIHHLLHDSVCSR